MHVRRAAALISRRQELDGFAGAITRLREAYDSLNQTFPLAWSPDELVDAMQTGDRLTYFPLQASENIEHFRVILPQAVAKVKELNKPLGEAVVAEVARRANVDPTQNSCRERCLNTRREWPAPTRR